MAFRNCFANNLSLMMLELSADGRSIVASAAPSSRRAFRRGLRLVHGAGQLPEEESFKRTSGRYLSSEKWLGEDFLF
jgi:hypothetical protein